MNTNEKTALENLIKIAKRDTGQSRHVANFLLAWWNAEDCGGFDLTTLWAVDDDIATDMMTVINYIRSNNHYPDKLGYKLDFTHLVETWRPEMTCGGDNTDKKQGLDLF